MGIYSVSRDPGGGGMCNPLMRDPEKVLEDVRQGYVSIECAEKDYGVAIRQTSVDFSLDKVKTRRIRQGNISTTHQ